MKLAASEPSIMRLPPDLSQIDKVLRLIDREVWIVTASDGPRRGGLLATWVSAASIDAERPVILAGLAPNHFTTELVQRSGSLAVKVTSTLDSNQVGFGASEPLTAGSARIGGVRSIVKVRSVSPWWPSSSVAERWTL